MHQRHSTSGWSYSGQSFCTKTNTSLLPVSALGKIECFRGVIGNYRDGCDRIPGGDHLLWTHCESIAIVQYDRHMWCLSSLDKNKISLLQHISRQDVTINRFKEIWRSLLKHLDKHNTNTENLAPELFRCIVDLLKSLPSTGELRNFHGACQLFGQHSNDFILDLLDAGVRALAKYGNLNVHRFLY